MAAKSTNMVCVVVPNWNGKDTLQPCLDSLLAQSLPCTVFVVENGSTDGSLEYLREKYPQVRLVVNQVNLGFAGGVNSGIREAIRAGFTYVALFNNDAVAKKDWLEQLVRAIGKDKRLGIVTCKLESGDKSHLDSTGDQYTVWGLPYPRGRGEPSTTTSYDSQTDIFGASGGASLYRVAMLNEVGLFDEDFFAYYEDVDISFRAQLAGWKVAFAPRAVAYHQIGATSSKLRGFTTYQTVKNLPWLLAKNVPAGILRVVLPRFLLAYTLFVGRAILRGHGWYALKGLVATIRKLPTKRHERRDIQTHKVVSNDYIWDMLTHDLPANAYNLRKLRAAWWKLTGKV